MSRLRSSQVNSSYFAGNVVFSALLVFGAITTAWAQAPAGSEAELRIRDSVRLEKREGGVDQTIPLPGGGWVVRDYTYEPPERQRIEFYDSRGRRTGEIAAYGKQPDKYVRLKDVAVDAEGNLWIADFGASRILRYDPDGELLSTILLQNPSYRPKALAVDGENGRVFVAGCYPTDKFLNRGCMLVHQYDLETGEFEGSIIETDPVAISKQWAGRSDYDLDLDADGAVYFVHEAVFKLYELDPDRGEITEVKLQTDEAEAPPRLSRETLISTEAKREAMAGSFRIDRVEASGEHVAVSIRKPHDTGYLLTVYDDDLEVLAQDLEAPGRLLGSTRDGGWTFLRRGPEGFSLVLASLDR